MNIQDVHRLRKFEKLFFRGFERSNIKNTNIKSNQILPSILLAYSSFLLRNETLRCFPSCDAILGEL